MAALFMAANIKNIPRLLRFGLDPITPIVFAEELDQCSF